MAKEAKKPTVEIEVECPNCKSILGIKVFKEKISDPAPPAEYEVTTQVTVDKQGHLFEEGEDAT